MFRYILCILIFSSANIWAADQIDIGARNRLVKPGVLTATILWVKDKHKKWDLSLQITNNNSRGIIVYLGDMFCKRGAATGQLKHTFFNTGERTIDFRPGQTKQFNMVCDTVVDATGPFQIEIARVYENANSDGHSAGRVIASGLKWRQSDKAGSSNGRPVASTNHDDML